MDSFRKAIAVDFDGVLHSYTSGWQGIGVIADPPVTGAIEWLIAQCLYGPYDIIINSCRCNESNGITAMSDWIEANVRAVMSKLPAYIDDEERLEDDIATIMVIITFAVQKPERAFIFIDDRSWQFNGTFPSMIELEKFIPWYRRSDSKS